MELHTFFCDVCGREFAESELMTLRLPVWNTGDAEADYYRDERFRVPSVYMRKMDVCVTSAW